MSHTKISISDMAKHFQKVTWNRDRNSFRCKCPCHNDSSPSLVVSVSGEKIIMHDFGGCRTEDILGTIGLTWADVGEERPRLTWADRISYGLRNKFGDGVYLAAEYRYTDEAGKYLYSKLRFQGGRIKGKEIRYAVVDHKKDSYSNGKPKGVKASLYNLPEALKAIDNGYPVYLTEGEKDVETLRKFHLTGVTAGGVKDWKPEFARFFTGAKVVILQDNDQPGKEFAERAERDLKQYAAMIKVSGTSEAEHGDVTDYLEEGHSIEELKQMLAAIPYNLSSWLYQDKSDNTKINADILQKVVSDNVDYLIVRRPDEVNDELYLYGNGVYSRINKNDMKGAIRKYIPQGIATDAALNNCLNLLLASGKRTVRNTDLNPDEYIVNVKNGLLNLKTRKLEPHTPKYYSTFQMNVVYDPEAKEAPVFTRFMEDLATGEDGVVDVTKSEIIREYGGMTLSNIPIYRAKKAIVLVSPQGNTGKTQLLNLITDFIGIENICNIAISDLNEQSKFAVGEIHGKRLIAVGDQTSAEIRDTAIFKQITGGDAVRLEQKNRRPITEVVKAPMWVLCNVLPRFSDDKGGHMFERFLIVPCTNTIPAEKRDPALLDKMKLEKSAIFNWFLQGAYRLLDNNYQLTKSEITEEAALEYRKNSDFLFRFISNHYILTGSDKDRIQRRTFNADYQLYCRLLSVNAVSRNNLHTRLKSMGLHVVKSHGVHQIVGIQRRSLEDEKEKMETLADEIDELFSGSECGARLEMLNMMRRKQETTL